MRPCSAHPTLLPKPELVLELTEEVLKIHPWWKLVFSKNASLEFIPCDFIKNELHHRDYLQGLDIFSRTRHLQLCNRQCLYLNVDADIANAEMPMPRFSNDLLTIYRGLFTLSNFQMAASKP